MANVIVKMFGVFRLSAGVKETDCKAETLEDVFDYINSISTNNAEPFSFKYAIVFINGERIFKKKHILKDNDEVWLMSPASGG